MLYGYKGRFFHIDLTREKCQSVPVTDEILMKYIDGRGLGAKLFWELVSLGVHGSSFLSSVKNARMNSKPKGTCRRGDR